MNGTCQKLKCGDIMTSMRNYNLNSKNKKHFIIGRTINQDIMMFDDIEKIHKCRTENTVKCECSHSVCIPAFRDDAICYWCGKKVYNTTKSHFKYKLRKMKDSD